MRLTNVNKKMQPVFGGERHEEFRIDLGFELLAAAMNIHGAWAYRGQMRVIGCGSAYMHVYARAPRAGKFG